MSAVTRPRGPLPARVYWIRRAVVLGVAFLLVFTVARVLGGGDGNSGDNDKAAPAAGTPTTSDPVTEGPEPQVTTGKDKGKKQKDKKSRKPQLAQPDGPCDPADVTIRSMVERVASSSEIRIPLKLTTKVPACTFEVSTDSVVVKITSGKDNIWSSQDCKGLATRSVVVRAEKPAWAPLIWNGRRSGVSCGPSALWALPGWYHVVAAPLGGEPTDKMFELTRQRAPSGDDDKKSDSKKKDSEKKGDRRG